MKVKFCNRNKVKADSPSVHPPNFNASPLPFLPLPFQWKNSSRHYGWQLSKTPLAAGKVKVLENLLPQPVENLLPQNADSIINYLRPQPATDNGVRDGRSNWLVAPPTLYRQGSTPWTPRIAQFNAGCKSQDLLHWLRCERATFGTLGQRTACAATQGIKLPQWGNWAPWAGAQ